MKWNNLNKNLCPKCGTMLEPHGQSEHARIVCANKKCDFIIIAKKMKEIITKNNRPLDENPDF